MTKSIDIRTSDGFVCRPLEISIRYPSIESDDKILVHLMKSESACMFSMFQILTSSCQTDDDMTTRRLPIDSTSCSFYPLKGRPIDMPLTVILVLFEAWKWDFTPLSFTQRSHSIWSRVEHNTTPVSQFVPAGNSLESISLSSLFVISFWRSVRREGRKFECESQTALSQV